MERLQVDPPLVHVGAIVHYVDPYKEHCRAEVRWVHKDDPLLVCLRVEIQSFGIAGIHDVVYSDHGVMNSLPSKCGTWHWPEWPSGLVSSSRKDVSDMCSGDTCGLTEERAGIDYTVVATRYLDGRVGVDVLVSGIIAESEAQALQVLMCKLRNILKSSEQQLKLLGK